MDNFIVTLPKLTSSINYSFWEICVKLALTLITYLSTVFAAKDMLNTLALYCQIYKAWILAFLFNFLFLFSFLFFILESRIRIRVISWSYCHPSVTLDNTVTVTVTQSYGYMEHDRRFKNNNII